MEIIKQVFGIDISKDSFMSSVGVIDTQQKQTIRHSKSYGNTKQGIQKFYTFALSQKLEGVPQFFIMEATGVYYESLAYYLKDKGASVIVVLANKANAFSKTMNIKSKTDALDTHMLTQMGLEKVLKVWECPSKLMKTLKSLTRDHHYYKEAKTRAKNRNHAKLYSYEPSKESLKRVKKEIKFYEQTLQNIESQITKLLKSDPDIWHKVENISQVKGLGMITIANILAETNAFALIHNAKQLSSYAGLDVVFNESGHFKGKTRISKKGNRYLRGALYMPALSASTSNHKMKQLYQRIVEKGKPKKVGLIAIARKLLILVYILWVNDREYLPEYQHAH